MSSLRVLVYNVSFLVFSQAPLCTRAPIKIMFKNVQVPRYNVKCLDCTDVNGKRKTKDREGNTSETICRVPSKPPLWMRFLFVRTSSRNNLFLLSVSSLAYFHVFPVLTVAKTHPHFSFRALSFSFPFHTVNRYITHSLPSQFLPLYFGFLSLSLILSLSFTFTLVHTLSLS